MSIRVHAFAKELGLTTKDLIERIQEWGLDVKPNPQAGIDAETEKTIRDRIHTRPSSEPPARPDARPTPPIPRENAAISPAAAAPPRPPSASPIAPTATAAESAPPRPAPASPIDTSPPTAPRPSGLAPSPTASGSTRSGLQGTRPTGPLSGHTPHRPGTIRANMGSSATALERPSTGQDRPSGPPPAPQPPRPLNQNDYISPTGTRGSSLGRPGVIPPPRRALDGSTGDSPRRDAQAPRPGASPGGSPLPPVASGVRRPLPGVGTGPPPVRRSTDGTRTAVHDSKTPQPVRRFTADEMREMMRRGQIGGGAGTPPAAPGRAPTAPRGPLPGPGRGPLPGPGRGPLPGPGPARPPSPIPLGPADRAGHRPPPPGDTGSGGEEEDRKGKPTRLGSPADRAGRRAKRVERASTRGPSGISSPVPAAALLDQDDDGRRSRGPKRHKKAHVLIAPKKTAAVVEPPVTVRSLSEAIGVKANELMRKFMQLSGELVTINAALEDEAAVELALEFGVELRVEYARTAEDDMLESFEADEESSEGRVGRPPIVTILGHVDHGKTSLLDYIRKANVVATESGGITQHIGAYQVVHEGRKVSFVDTPGHEAFTAMRARGANVTDIAVVVVAADDGVMPQTQEAIAHAKAAGVQIIVALNKIDLPGAEANLQKIFGELSKEGLIPEEYGGETMVVKTSALSGLGVPDLLERILLLADLHEFKADPDRPATGTCLEASLSDGRGVVATVLVQDGTVRVGDVIVCGEAYGRVRSLADDKGLPLQEAGPSTPVEVSGLDSVPTAGEKFAVVDDVIRARSIAETRRSRTRGATLVEPKAITLENLYTKMAEQKLKSLNLILKADVQGSLEALVKELDKLQNDEVPLRILHKGVGGIGESDIILADASEAIVVGFRVAPEDRAVTLAEEKKIDIRRYDIIYQVADEVKQAIEGRLEPDVKEVHLGRAAVRQVFKISRGGAGTVAGCFVTQGVIERNGQARIIREGREIYKGSIEALRRFKDDVKEVRENFECGIKIAKYDDLKVDDLIEAYRIEVTRRTLGS